MPTTNTSPISRIDYVTPHSTKDTITGLLPFWVVRPSCSTSCMLPRLMPVKKRRLLTRAPASRQVQGQVSDTFPHPGELILQHYCFWSELSSLDPAPPLFSSVNGRHSVVSSVHTWNAWRAGSSNRKLIPLRGGGDGVVRGTLKGMPALQER
jgi:hypothetical protein